MNDISIKKIVKNKIKIQKPKQYSVVLLNNNETSFEAVVDVLATVFHLNVNKATQVMQTAHNVGKAQCFANVMEICNTKAAEARAYCIRRQDEMLFEGRSMYYDRLIFEVEENDKGDK